LHRNEKEHQQNASSSYLSQDERMMLCTN